MSEQPQGPGWWLASDGRYYPPQPGPAAPPAPGPQGYPPSQGYPPRPGQPPYAQPQPYASPQWAVPPPRSGGGGKVVAIVVVVLVLLVGVPLVGGYFLLGWAGHKAADAVGVGPCSLVSDAVASRGVGRPVALKKGSGLGGLMSDIIDSRVLPNAPSCWGTTRANGSTSAGTLVRIAVQDGDAKARFATEVKRAKGEVLSSSTGPDGTTTSVSSAPYYGKPVEGLGDEAFCTELGLTGTVGVLTRRGDRLVYAAVGTDFGTTSTPDPSAGVTPPDEDATCRRAQQLARAVLAG